MKRLFYFLLTVTLGISSNILQIFAGDTITVQTFTFDDIYKRRGKFFMPPKSEEFSKILMLYTLKCDPKTPHDKYNCGEWDYLTYNMIYTKTGIFDSTKYTKPRLSYGYQTPDTLFYGDKVQKFKTQKVKYSTSLISAQNEQTIPITTNELQGGIDGESVHIQFILKSKDLRDLGLKTGNYQKMQFFSSSVGSKLNNLTIKLKNTSNTTTDFFDNYSFTTVFKGDYEIKTNGLQDIFFITPFNWSQFQNLLIDVSFEQDISNPVLFNLGTKSNMIYSTKDESYLKFEGPNDYIDCGNITELNNASKVTFEAWVNINKWSNWSAIINKNDQIFLGTGDQLGQIYCIIRNPNNTYGYSNNAIKVGEWTHVAMVFDGTKPSNEDKLKLVVNGKEIKLTYNGQLPDKTSENTRPFTISSNIGSTSSIFANIDEVRVWNEALNLETLSEYKDNTVPLNHPNYNNLIGYYNFNESTGFIVNDLSPKYNHGILIGVPSWEVTEPSNQYFNQVVADFVPYLTISKGDYSIKVDSTGSYVEKDKEMISIVEYEIINNDISIKKVNYHPQFGWIYNFNADGSISDSVFVPIKSYYVNDKITYYSAPFEKMDEIEIGRFITPYGINLDLGPEGFTWVYDVTDYEPYLHDSVDFAAGNLQELIDVKFLFIKGTPPRKVNKIHKVWGNMRSISYKNLSDDKELSKITLDLLPDSKSFKVKTRLSGHGHNSNDGNYPHCCEWKDNTHYLYSGTDLISSWHIWQTNDCALNPVYPQGGTWPGSREGWCPGDVVKDFDFEVTKYVKNNQLNLDYDITKVPQDNLGMGNGNYVSAFQLFEYGENSYNIDAEVYDVIMPSSNDYYSRTNPICSDPSIIIRNNGKDDLTSLEIEYYVQGGIKSNYKWNGNIASMRTERITLPVPSSNFWIGDGKNKFLVNISKPNGQTDMNISNDQFISDFKIPDLLTYDTKVVLKTNLRGQHFSYKITDVLGNVVTQKSGLSNNSTYDISLNLPQGCYTLEVTDLYNYGLSYWAVPDQGTGFLKIVDTKTNKDLKVFNPDFGHGVKYSFFVGSYSLIQEPNLDEIVYLFPNPAENLLNISVNDFSGQTEIALFDINGNQVLAQNENVEINKTITVPTNMLTSGTYILKIKNGDRIITKKFIKK